MVIIASINNIIIKIGDIIYLPNGVFCPAKKDKNILAKNITIDIIFFFIFSILILTPKCNNKLLSQTTSKS